MVDAIRMFEEVEAGRAPLLGRVVGIVGGGNTAMDAARVAKRLGAEEAILIYRRDREHMRADPYEADEAFLEGVKAEWLTNPVRFGAEGVTVETIELGDDGSLSPTGGLETLPVDALVLALGQHAETRLPAQGRRRRDRPRRDGGRRRPADDRPAGPLRRRRRHRRPDDDDRGDRARQEGGARHRCVAARRTPRDRGEKAPPVDFDMLNLPHFLDAGRSQMSALPLEARNGFAEVVAGIDARQARYEADRCLSCGNCFECDNCFAACPEQAVIKLGKGRKYTVDLDLCTGCAVCYDQCPCHAIEMVPEPVAALPKRRACRPTSRCGHDRLGASVVGGEWAAASECHPRESGDPVSIASADQGATAFTGCPLQRA